MACLHAQGGFELVFLSLLPKYLGLCAHTVMPGPGSSFESFMILLQVSVASSLLSLVCWGWYGPYSVCPTHLPGIASLLPTAGWLSAIMSVIFLPLDTLTIGPEWSVEPVKLFSGILNLGPEWLLGRCKSGAVGGHVSRPMVT